MNDRRTSNYKAIACLNILGFGLLIWHAATWPGGFLFGLDTAVFRFFNARITAGTLLADIAVVTNHKMFDAAAFLAMGLLYLRYFLKADNAGKRRMIAIGLVMLGTGILIKQLGRFSPIQHASPTLFFDDAYRLGKHVAAKVKDSARETFPGDHGIMLMVFTAFMARYFGKKAFLAAACIVMLFSLPRILIGAHWLTDIYIGSLSVICIAGSWLLLTPASDRLAGLAARLIPRWLFPGK